MEYHSFNDIELFEPPSPPRANKMSTSTRPTSSEKDHPLTAVKMQRQDSGYESRAASSPRTSATYTRPSCDRRTSRTCSISGTRPRTSRPCTRRSTKSAQTHPYRQGGSDGITPLYLVRPNSVPIPPHEAAAYFHFPSPDPDALVTVTPEQHAQPLTPVVPQTTHYWTSDDTRRLEYATIDAASRGFKGWVRRNLVPDCFVPGANRHVSFDDDTGSVRRYRLELEEDGKGVREDAAARKWQFWAS